MTKAIVFDFFDVIHRDPFHHWLKESGLERGGEFESSSNLLDLGEIDDAEFYRQLGEASGQPSEQVEASFAERVLIDQDMLKIITELKQSYKVGLLSNSSIKYIWDIIKAQNIAPLFDAITVSAEVRLIKPDPKIFEHILAKLNVKSEEAIFVDDNPKNVESAKTLGMQAIVFSGAAQLTQDFKHLSVLAS